MEIRELELGGIYNIGNYENVRVSVRVAINPGTLGNELARLANIVDKLAETVAALRIAAREVSGLWKKSMNAEKEARHFEEMAIRAKESAREEARKRLEPIIDKLAPEIRSILEKEPEKAWDLGVLDTSCVHLRDYNDYVKKAADHRRLAEELRSRAQEISKLRQEIIELLHEEKIDEAHELAKRLLNKIEPFGEENEEW